VQGAAREELIKHITDTLTFIYSLLDRLSTISNNQRAIITLLLQHQWLLDHRICIQRIYS